MDGAAADRPAAALGTEPRPPRVVVCGTDTDVGKTVVSAWLVQGLNAHYWKPVQSGLEGGGDRGRVASLLNLPAERQIPEVYRLQAAAGPVQAEQAGRLRHQAQGRHEPSQSGL